MPELNLTAIRDRAERWKLGYGVISAMAADVLALLDARKPVDGEEVRRAIKELRDFAGGQDPIADILERVARDRDAAEAKITALLAKCDRVESDLIVFLFLREIRAALGSQEQGQPAGVPTALAQASALDAAPQT